MSDVCYRRRLASEREEVIIAFAMHGPTRRKTETQHLLTLKPGMSNMHVDKGSRILRQCAAVLTLTAAATVGTTSVAATNLFEQPLESGIASNMFVAHVTKAGMPKGTFDLVLLQPNPETSTGYLVPTSWNAGSKTGFEPASPSIAQLGFRNQVGASTAQMEGDTVGAYLNSKDLPTTLSNQLMMISPQYIWPSGSTPVPFASSSSVLNGEMDLQVPTAVGKKVYVAADLSFLDANGVRFSYSVVLFHNGINGGSLPISTNFNAAEHIYILDAPLKAGQQFISLVSGSASVTGAPWAGFRHFQWSINQAQFVAALKYLESKFPGKITSTDPTQYQLVQVHLNAEMNFSNATPSELGWSMRGMNLWVN
jgi:hypothetical protein